MKCYILPLINLSDLEYLLYNSNTNFLVLDEITKTARPSLAFLIDCETSEISIYFYLIDTGEEQYRWRFFKVNSSSIFLNFLAFY